MDSGFFTQCNSMELVKPLQTDLDTDGSKKRVYILIKELGVCLFNDPWSQLGHSVPCMTILFPILAKY